MAQLAEDQRRATEEAELKGLASDESARRREALEKERAQREKDELARKKAADAQAAKDKAAKDKADKAKRDALDEEERKRLAKEEKDRLAALKDEEARLKKEADKKAKDRAADESARRRDAAAKEAERQRKLAEQAAEDARQNAKLAALEAEKNKKRDETIDAKSRADALEEKTRNLQDAQRKSREEDDWSDASSRSSQDILERLLRTFVHTAAGTLRTLADENPIPGQISSSAEPYKYTPSQQVPYTPNEPVQAPPFATSADTFFQAAPETQYPSAAMNAKFNQTAPAFTGPPRSAPVVPPLWQPHPRSDGFIGFRVPSSVGSECSESVAASEPGTQRLAFGGAADPSQGNTVPTFVPQTLPLSQPRSPIMDNAATLPYAGYGQKMESDLPTFQPVSAHGGEYEQTWAPNAGPLADPYAVTSQRSARPVIPAYYNAAVPSSGNLVDPEIMNRLAALLCAPSTPPGEFERYARYGGEKPPDTNRSYSNYYQPPPYQPQVYQAPSHQPWARDPEPQKQSEKLVTPPVRQFGSYEEVSAPKQPEETIGRWDVPSYGDSAREQTYKPAPAYDNYRSGQSSGRSGQSSARGGPTGWTPREQQVQQPAGNWQMPSPSQRSDSFVYNGRPTSAGQYSDASLPPRQSNLAVPQKHMPAASDASSAAWSAPFAQDEPVNQDNRAQTSSSQAERNAELGIPSLPLATITSSSFGAASGGNKELGLAFSAALDQLTNAMYRSADALDSFRSGASSRPSWDQPAVQPLPMPISEVVPDSATGPDTTLSEADFAYRAPFSNYAGLKVDSAKYKQPQQIGSGSGYDQEIRQLTKQFANLSGRSDASSESRKSLPMTFQWNAANSASSGAQGPRAGTRGLSVMVGSSTRRPDAQEIQEMAEDIGDRCGVDQVQPAMAMLGVMTDVLFGARSNGTSVVPSHVQRPTPRTLEAITERVIQRTSNTDQADAIRELVMKLTNSVFGVAEELPTARSSVRSQSTTSEQVKQEVNLEARGLLTELCGELFSQ